MDMHERALRQAANDLEQAITLIGMAHRNIRLASSRIDGARTGLKEPWRLDQALFVASEEMKAASRGLGAVQKTLTEAAQVPQERLTALSPTQMPLNRPGALQREKGV